MPRLEYPPARRVDVVDEIHGVPVADPYRWLEDPDNPDTKAWSEAQDRLVREHLDGLPGRDVLLPKLQQLPGAVGMPYVVGDRCFFTRRQPGEQHARLFVREGDEERVLVDPNAMSDDATTTLDAWSPSKEGDRLAFQVSEGGNEESVLRVMDVATGDIVDGPIDRCRYSSIAWLPGGEAFFYVRRLPADQVPAGESQFHRRVYLHRIGTDADTADELVFGDGSDKTTYFAVSTSRDGRWLTISASLGTAPRNDLWIVDLAAEERTFTVVQEGVDADTWGTVHRDGRLYLSTNLDAPRGRLCVADPEKPQVEHWTDLLPETEHVLTGYTLTDDALVAVYTKDVVSRISVHDKTTGAPQREIELPGHVDAGVTSRTDGGSDVWIGYTDFLTPFRIIRHDVATEVTETWAETPGAADVKGLTIRQVFYPSKDGTKIPMFVMAREDVPLDGQQPTILYGYGGFNVSMSPAYSHGIATWAELGGVYAVANLRGGSEYGEEWHRAGMRDKKQNVYDDFVGAAEFLIAEGYTSPQHLAISGGSNGGLLVGATVTQRPDLFAAVVCSAPLLDMIRYELFGLGTTWNDEYGAVAIPEEFRWLLGYSPYHNVHEGTDYPAVLFTVFDSDTRVDPLHGRKLCAALQHATSGDRPILIRREQNVGHSARSVDRTIQLQLDTMSFLAFHTGLSIQ